VSQCAANNEFLLGLLGYMRGTEPWLHPGNPSNSSLLVHPENGVSSLPGGAAAQRPNPVDDEQG